VPAVTNIHLDLQEAYNLRSVSFVVRADENLGRLSDMKKLCESFRVCSVEQRSIRMAQERKDVTPPYGYLIRLFQCFPDFDPPFIKPVRQKAVELLHLKAGDRVLDAGCGPGGSFPYLVRAVGQSGQVVGVEISPEISMNAKRRIAKNGWGNVQVIEAAAQDGTLSVTPSLQPVTCCCDR
jgi:tRNA/tmRNA/rRNA uracil-C5-methylase (TrmA/RlmC/RlmD family)